MLYFITVPYPKPLITPRPAIFLLNHDKPCLTTSFCLVPLCPQLWPNTKDTMARALHPEGCTRSHTEHTWQIWLNSRAPFCHLANVSPWRPWQIWTLQFSMDSFLKDYCLHSKDKAHTKNYSFSSRATDSYALAHVTVSTSTWVKYMWNSEIVPYYVHHLSNKLRKIILQMCCQLLLIFHS